MSRQRSLAGIGFGLAAYGMWGFFPLYFRQLVHVPPLDILCHRAAWGCGFVALILSVQGRWHGVRTIAAQPRYLLLLACAAVLIAGNWLLFLWAVARGQVIASSLGYFLTPLVNVLLGLLVLKERLDAREWLAVGLACAAVVNEMFSLGELPWISLLLAATFGVYGLIRKQVPVDAVSGLWLETAAMLPAAGLYTLWQSSQGHGVYTGHDGRTQALLALAGILTALPLLAFAAAARRLSLSSVGMLMYINPTLQFLTAVYLFGEPMAPARLITFSLIWAGLLVYTWNAWRKYAQPASASV